MTGNRDTTKSECFHQETSPDMVAEQCVMDAIWGTRAQIQLFFLSPTFTISDRVFWRKVRWWLLQSFFIPKLVESFGRHPKLEANGVTD